MAKAKTFADKIAKSMKDFRTHCPQCGEALIPIELVTSEYSERTHGWRFNKRFVTMCKCNEKEIIQ